MLEPSPFGDYRDATRCSCAVLISNCREVYERERPDAQQFGELLGDLEAIKGEVRRLSQTLDSIYLFGPGPQPEIAAFVTATDQLLELLGRQQKTRRRKFLRSDLSRAAVCAHVLAVTGEPHDDQVAALWWEIELYEAPPDC